MHATIESMQNALGSSVRFLKAVWRIIRWPIYILVIIYVALVIYELYAIPKRSAEAVAAIHAQKLTMKDVDGSNLPPTPDPKLVDATVEGVDANNNGIRDDVELAIFKKYPNDLKLRAAALQYAQNEGEYLTEVVDTNTWKAVAEESGRANLCIADATPDYQTGTNVINYIQSLIYNNSERSAARGKAFENITSHGDADGPNCDVAL